MIFYVYTEYILYILFVSNRPKTISCIGRGYRPDNHHIQYTKKKGLMQIEQILAGGVGETIYKSHRQLRRSHHHVAADDLRLGRGTRSIARCLLAIGIAVGRRRR